MARNYGTRCTKNHHRHEKFYAWCRGCRDEEVHRY